MSSPNAPVGTARQLILGGDPTFTPWDHKNTS